MDLIDERDMLRNMMKYIGDLKRLLEYSIYLREPWLIPLWEDNPEESLEVMLEKIKIFNKKKYYYYHISPVVDLYYYLDAKYGFSERYTEKSIDESFKGEDTYSCRTVYRELTG